MNFKKFLILLTFIALIFSCSKKSEGKKPIKEEILKNVNKMENAGKKLTEEINKKAKELIPAKEKKEKIKKISNESKAKLWDIYKTTKQKIKEAKMQERFNELIDLLKKEADISKKLGRTDIQAWQLNNIGYYSIEEFKKRIKYDETMAKIYATTNKKEKKKLYDTLKRRMKENFAILQNSYDYLLEAKKLSSENKDEKQKKIIANNISFINDIKKMIDKAEKK